MHLDLDFELKLGRCKCRSLCTAVLPCYDEAFSSGVTSLLGTGIGFLLYHAELNLDFQIFFASGHAHSRLRFPEKCPVWFPWLCGMSCESFVASLLLEKCRWW